MEVNYKLEYEDFVRGFQQREIDSREVGEMIAKMAVYFGMYNLEMVVTLRAYTRALRDISNQTDLSGKLISGTRAEQLAEATDEYHDYQMSKAHVSNIEQIINALKALQRGVMNERNNSA